MSKIATPDAKAAERVGGTTGTCLVKIVNGGGLSASGQREVIDVLYQGFRRKLHKLLLVSDSRQQIKRILPQVIDFSQSLVALRIDESRSDGPGRNLVCGVLLMNLGTTSYLHYDWRLARREFGLWGSIYRRLNYAIVNTHKPAAGELNIQALAVRRGMRCRGIGGRMLAAAEEFANRGGYDRLSLEVVDSNPGAKRLYQRVGFQRERTQGTWPYTARAGFRSSDYMVKRLAGIEATAPLPRKPR